MIDAIGGLPQYPTSIPVLVVSGEQNVGVQVALFFTEASYQDVSNELKLISPCGVPITLFWVIHETTEGGIPVDSATVVRPFGRA